MQLEIGMSTRRYLPASGTAGLARSRVSGNSRVPCPPPMIIERTLLRLADMRAPLVIGNPFLLIVLSLLYPADPTMRKRQATSNEHGGRWDWGSASATPILPTLPTRRDLC